MSISPLNILSLYKCLFTQTTRHLSNSETSNYKVPSLSLKDTVPAQGTDNLSFPSEMTQDRIMPLIKVKKCHICILFPYSRMVGGMILG